jgi:GntR family transcriptional regulator / MocR family aminotransferase
MLPFNNLIVINKTLDTPVYLQIGNSIIRLIQDGILKKENKLPGTRALSELLKVHRKTIVAAYSELAAQGWIQIKSSDGAYISGSLPDIKPKKFKETTSNFKVSTGFPLRIENDISVSVYTRTNFIEINDGLPDIRIAPMESLSRTIRSILLGERGKFPLSYSDIEGYRPMRIELSHYLNETRGLISQPENVFITRGTIMGLYLSLSVLLEAGDNVVVESPGYRVVSMIVKNLGGNVIRIPVDENGLIVEEVEKLCLQKKLRVIYVTPHHHYPTAVTMPPERRIALLALAEKYGIAILEDDYDYDYHYSHSPFLPLASSDPAGCVIYIGSFSKTLSPAFRIGYVVAPENFIKEITKKRRIIDRQGDSVLEAALAEMLKLGEIRSHMKRSHKIYKIRRDLFCHLLKERLSEFIDFKIPEGGMAVWGKFQKDLPMIDVSKTAAGLNLLISDGQNYGSTGRFENSTRMGFAALNEDEIVKAIDLLEVTVRKVKKCRESRSAENKSSAP